MAKATIPKMNNSSQTKQPSPMQQNIKAIKTRREKLFIGQNNE